MAADSEYDEVDAVVRVPKGKNLAGSKKTPGWSRGFTPKSSETGPEHVEIRIKDKEPSCDAAPEVIYVYDDAMQIHQQEDVDRVSQALAFAQLVADVAPPVIRWWNEQALPSLRVRQEERRERRERREASTPTVGQVRATSEAAEVGGAVETYVAAMDGAEARRHLAELLIAKRFVDEKQHLLATVRITESVGPQQLGRAVDGLTPAQVEDALGAILASDPALLDDMRRLEEAGGSDADCLVEGRRRSALPRVPRLKRAQ